jgi:hypothetical protein
MDWLTARFTADPGFVCLMVFLICEVVAVFIALMFRRPEPLDANKLMKEAVSEREADRNLIDLQRVSLIDRSLARKLLEWQQFRGIK